MCLFPNRKVLFALCILLTINQSYAQLFGPPIDITRQLETTIGSLKEMQVVDMDVDGDSDVLTAIRSGDDGTFGFSAIQWHENLGGDRWKTNVVAENIGNTSVHAVDLNGDGHIDVLSCSKENGKLWALYNQGDNTFSKELIDDSLFYARKVFCKDLDGDGDIEIFCAYNKRIVWYNNWGGGNFSKRRVITNDAENTTHLIVEDLNNDGLLDVVNMYGPNYDRKVAWHENLGSNTFSAQQVISTGVGGPFTEDYFDLEVHDMDGDGDLDILRSGIIFTLTENLGGGSFAPEVEISGFGGDLELEVFDVDQDGDPDIVSSKIGPSLDSALCWIENLGGGIYKEIRSISGLSHTIWLPHKLEAADLDNDGNLDLLGYSAGCELLCYWRNDGSGTFTEAPSATINKNASYVGRDIVSADLDGDGDEDVICSSFCQMIGWYENTGGGTFDNSFRVISMLSTYTDFHPVDFNGDGAIDIIASSDSRDEVACFINNGDGTFSPRSNKRTVIDPRDVFAADLDNDGDPDILIAERYQVVWFENLGGGALGFKQVISAAVNNTTAIRTGDLDGDGDQDIVSSSYYDNKVAWYENLGSGSFGPQINLAVGSPLDGARDVEIADLDGDGNLDIAACSYTSGTLVWYRNLGLGAFSGRILITNTQIGSIDITTADLDNDGDLDLLCASYLDDKLAWYENTGSGTFGPENLIGSDLDKATIAVVSDFDLDGDIDVLGSGLHNGLIAWFENLSPQDCSAPPIGLSHSYTDGSPNGTLDLNWQEIPTANFQIRIEKTSSAIPKSKIFISSTNNFSITAAFKPWHTYRWKVRAACPTDSSGWSSYEVIDIPSVRHNELGTSASMVMVSPNPATTAVNISLGDFEDAGFGEGSWQLTVFGTNGQLVHLSVFPTQDQRVSIQIESWPEGLYYFQLENNGRLVKGSFIKE